MTGSSCVHDFAGRTEHANLAPVPERLAAHAFALAGGEVVQHDIGNVERGLAFHDAARLLCLRVRLGVALDHVDVLHEHALARDAGDLAVLALVLARDHEHRVAFSNSVHNVDLCRAGFNPPFRRLRPAVCGGLNPHLSAGQDPPYNTSGASETIFMKRSLRSSRVTGPKMRVPIGSSLLFNSTAALSSKRITDPSGRRTPLAVRTTTAL